MNVETLKTIMKAVWMKLHKHDRIIIDLILAGSDSQNDEQLSYVRML